MKDERNDVAKFQRSWYPVDVWRSHVNSKGTVNICKEERSEAMVTLML